METVFVVTIIIIIIIIVFLHPINWSSVGEALPVAQCAPIFTFSRNPILFPLVIIIISVFSKEFKI